MALKLSLRLAQGSGLSLSCYAARCSARLSYHSLEERLHHGDCSGSAQSSIHGGVEGDWRRLGVPGSGSLLLAVLLPQLDSRMHPPEASSPLEMKKGAAGEVGLTHGHPNLFVSNGKMDERFILKHIPRVCGCPL